MMMTQNKKIKINLQDYQYKKDIEQRLFLASLSPFEVKALQEIFFFGSKFNFSDLQDSLVCSESELSYVLAKFSKTGLLLQQEEMVFIDRDLRKYFEFHAIQFEEGYEPDFHYFQQLLKKVPISTLPIWYNLPKTSDTIFGGIVEKYLATPKLYEKHLEELLFDHPACREIVDRVLQHPNHCIPAKTLRDALNLSKETFQECLLLLEFHVACVGSFIFENNQWIEVVTPFHEYKTFLAHQQQTTKSLLDSNIEKYSTVSVSEPFAFYKSSVEQLQQEYGHQFISVEKSVRELEKALRGFTQNEWIYLDDFIARLTAPIGQKTPVNLERLGKKWRYTLPDYSEDEKKFIKHTLFELFFKMNITTCGTHQARPCFAVTPFGKIALGE